MGYYTLYRPTQHAPEEEGGGGSHAGIFIKIFINCAFFLPFLTILTALFYPYIAHEQTAKNLILSVRSVLCLKERHHSQNEGSLKSEERSSDFKAQYAQLCYT